MHTFCEQGGVCCDNDLNSQYNWGDVDDTPATDDIYFGSVNAGTNNNTCNDLLYSNTFILMLLIWMKISCHIQVINGCFLRTS